MNSGTLLHAILIRSHVSYNGIVKVVMIVMLNVMLCMARIGTTSRRLRLTNLSRGMILWIAHSGGIQSFGNGLSTHDDDGDDDRRQVFLFSFGNFFYDDYACRQDGQDGLGIKMLLSYCHNFVDLYQCGCHDLVSVRRI